MRTLLSCALLAGGLAAQTTISLTSASPLSVMTHDASANSTWATVAANTAISSWPNSVSLSTSQSPTGKFFSVGTNVYPTQPYQGGIGFNYFESASCRGVAGDFAGTSAAAAQAGATLGAHVVDATLSAAPGTAGVIRISLLANSGTNGTATATVDIDIDNTIDFSQSSSASVNIPYTIGASGQVSIRVTNECSVPGVGLSTFNRAYSQIFVGFYPDLTATCTMTSYGQGCGNVTATGSNQVNGTTRTLTVDTTGCYPNDPVIVAVGSVQLSLPLLLGCSLLTNAESVTLLTADATGVATANWNVPHTLLGTSYVQMLPISQQGNTLLLSASNGVRIQLTR